MLFFKTFTLYIHQYHPLPPPSPHTQPKTIKSNTVILYYRCFVCFRYLCNAVQRRRNEKNSRKYDADSLPSYTIVTGLPTYDEAVERMNGDHNYGGAASIRDNKPPSKQVSVSVVHIRDDVPTPPKPDPKFGLVSHSLFVHDDGCSHCLSVQELLETYNVR